jgi:hypothetical protein
MFNDPREQEFHDYFTLFELGCYSEDGYCPLWPLFKSPESTRLLRDKVKSMGGLPSISAFILAFNSLRDSGVIAQLRQPKPDEIETPELTAEQYHSLPIAVVQRRWQSDPDFRHSVQNLMDAGKI